MRRLIGWLIILWSGSVAQATLELPEGLNSDARQSALRMIGIGTSLKLVSDPYPLGGYAGVEVGLQSQYLPSADWDFASTGSTSMGDTLVQTLTLGKGLFSNVDVFLSFTPWGRSAGLQQYGVLVRWGFFEAKYFPLSGALLLHADVVNVQDELTAQSTGGELIAAINGDRVAVYFGGGLIRADGRFAPSVTDSGQVEAERAQSGHTLAGAMLRLEPAFLAAQVDFEASETVYSAKLGIRY